ncbi:MAG: amidohydrolase family protein [Tildeniella torsiva UHER 1998/13D]|nr:amidohydrolase family protein [Tildeniella torsiva UHER 1998/13D]
MTTIRLVRGRWILTGDRVLPDGAIAIQADTILALGPWETLRAQYPNAEVLGSDQFLVMPGLINAHHHSNGVSHILQGVDDDFLELWLLANLTLRPQPPQLKTLLSIAQLLQSGVTTVVDVASVSGTADACLDNLQERLQAYERAGMRVALTPGAIYESRLIHHEDEAFLASLPTPLRQRLTTLLPLQQALAPEDYLALMTELVKRYGDHPHIAVWFGPPGPQWVGDDFLVRIVEAAHHLNTQIQTHAVESFHEKLIGPRFHGKSMIAHLQDLGVLSPRFSMAHGTWVTEADIDILAATGAAISHNPSSNLRLRAGVAPLNALLAGGVTVGLGMDGTTLGDDEDMFAEMRLAARLHRTPQLGSPAPSHADIFHLATTGGATLMGQADRIGKLAPGYRADLVLVNCDRLTSPWVAPEVDPFRLTVLRAQARDVDTVLVNGRVVLEAGLPTGFDLHAVQQELAAQLDATPAPEAYRDLVAELKPLMAQWYDQWENPPLIPYAAFNSRR